MIAEEPISTRVLPGKSAPACIALLCQQCRAALVPDIATFPSKDAALNCEQCGSTTRIMHGIWRCISPDKLVAFNRFVHDYEFIRNAEGRGGEDASYYLALPFHDLSRRNARQWEIRARTYRHLSKRVLEPMASQQQRALKILDLGAGNCWLSYRLSLLGHQLVAVDLLVNAQDGLGAQIHYRSHLQSPIPCVQAAAEDLPFFDATFDVVIFNASFHYSTNYEATMREALRCITPAGAVVIADSPWYATEESGERMVADKRRHFLTKYRFASDSLASQEYLTPERIRHLAENCSVRWTMSRPSHGIRWALRPFLATIRGRREPSRFYLHTARREP